MRFRDVINQFHDQNGFTYAGTTEQTNFTALRIRGEEIDHFNAGYQHLRFR